MTLTLVPETAPIAQDDDGVARISGTRVTLDTIVIAFNDGASAEEIAQRYPSVALADVYAVISYYLRRRDEVDLYLSERSEAADRVRGEINARHNLVGIRARLLARCSG